MHSFLVISKCIQFVFCVIIFNEILLRICISCCTENFIGSNNCREKFNSIYSNLNDQFRHIRHFKGKLESSTKASVEDSFPMLPNCDKIEVRKPSWNVTRDGYLKIIENKMFVFYPPGNYCLTQDDKIAVICSPSRTKVPKWKKCCGEGELLDYASNTCTKITNRYTFRYRPRIDSELQGFVTNDNTNVPICREGSKLQRYSTDHCNSPISSSKSFNRFLLENEVQNEYNCSFQLNKNGDILYETTEGLFLRELKKKPLLHKNYCLDGTFYENETTPCNRIVDGDGCIHENKIEILLFCDAASVSDEYSNETKSLFMAITWLSTCPLLLISALANLLFVQQNVHGWTLSAYLISMFLVNIGSVLVVLQEKVEGCRFADFFIKFTYFSTLCWMTSINFGLWRAFRKANAKKTSPKRFLFYLLFCSILPAFVVTLSYFMGRQHTCADERKQKSCALYNHETLPYYTYPVIAIIVINLGLFLRTTVTIVELRKETNAVLHRTRKDNLESFRLFTKLFLMTGSIWVIRVLLMYLQIKGLYFTWYGVALEVVFSTPEAVFSITVLLHPRFVKWTWTNHPRLAKNVQRVVPCFQPPIEDIGLASFKPGLTIPSA